MTETAARAALAAAAVVRRDPVLVYVDLGDLDTCRAARTSRLLGLSDL